jgi:hypothetical protein
MDSPYSIREARGRRGANQKEERERGWRSPTRMAEAVGLSGNGGLKKW